MTEAGVIHAGDNPSNHSPIYTKLQLNGIDPSTEPPVYQQRVNWAKASEEARLKYNETLAEELQKIVTPPCIECMDVYCRAHTVEMEDYTMAILEAVESAAKKCLPSTCGGGEGEIIYYTRLE